MAAAPATPAPAEGDAPKGGKKKLIIIIGVVVALLLAVGGGAAYFMMKKKAAEEAAALAADEEDGGDGAQEEKSHKAAGAHAKDEHGTPPTFVPLDPFTVNLTDKDMDRYAQVGLSLQVSDPHLGDELKNYMPAIRNAILLLLSHKSSADLLSPEGKDRLAKEIRRDAARAMGYEVEDPFAKEDPDPVDEDGKKKKKKRKKKKTSQVENPITQVHYANLIIQ